jgi:molybdopterin converting factor small subunit
MPSGSRATPASIDAPASVEVRVLLFSILREHVGAGEVTATLPAPATGRTLLDWLSERYPGVSTYRSVFLLAVNEQYVPLDTPLHDGDDVALITPVSGG